LHSSALSRDHTPSVYARGRGLPKVFQELNSATHIPPSGRAVGLRPTCATGFRNAACAMAALSRAGCTPRAAGCCYVSRRCSPRPLCAARGLLCFVTAGGILILQPVSETGRRKPMPAASAPQNKRVFPARRDRGGSVEEVHAFAHCAQVSAAARP